MREGMPSKIPGAHVLQLSGEPRAVEIEHLNARSAVSLKSWLPEHERGGCAAELEGGTSPSVVGATRPGAVRVLCLAPGEWLIVSNTVSSADLIERAQRQVSGQGLTLVDLSQALTVLQIRGHKAREVLCKGCGLDLHPRSFPIGRCARTRFAQIPVIIDCADAQQVFDLYVGRSHSSYLISWLTDSAVEFEDAENAPLIAQDTRAP